MRGIGNLGVHSLRRAERGDLQLRRLASLHCRVRSYLHQGGNTGDKCLVHVHAKSCLTLKPLRCSRG
jgi:hypothetical protein